MRESRVVTPEDTAWLFERLGIKAAPDLVLVAREPLMGKLRYRWSPVKTYLQQNCNPEENACLDKVFELDCTHFVCHALNKSDVYVKIPSVNCQSNLCIRVNDLAASFFTSTQRYSNVTQLSTHAQTREGDYCFIPGWFGIDKDHVMVLAGPATATGASVWGHTNARCDQLVAFDGEDCIYYRITEAVS